MENSLERRQEDTQLQLKIPKTKNELTSPKQAEEDILPEESEEGEKDTKKEVFKGLTKPSRKFSIDY